MQFNEKLKELRLKKGILQTALAEKIFVSRSAVAKWENGLGLPSEQSLNMLADFFGVQPSELLSDPIIETAMVTKNSIICKQKKRDYINICFFVNSRYYFHCALLLFFKSLQNARYIANNITSFGF